MDKYLQLAIDASIDAGKEVMKIYKQEYTIETKKDNSPVTKADLLANTTIYSYLEQTQIPILSEESDDTSSRATSQYVWIIDPIDGTRGFINKDGEFAIQIGLVKDETPVLGVVYLPAKNKLYYAQKDKGAFLKTDETTKQLLVSHKQSFSDSIVFMSKNHFTSEMEELVNSLHVKEVHHVGGIGVKFGLIAEGISDFDCKPTGNCAEWDLCAPQIILEEAGGYVYDFYGNPLHYNTIHRKIANGYIATILTNKEEILKNMAPYLKKRL